MNSTPILNGKHAVVFGAGGSIGAAVAKEFATEGAEVFLSGRTKSTVESVASQIISTAAGRTLLRLTPSMMRPSTLELKTDKSEEVKQRILDFGVKKLDVPDPHLYFQAPGGQVFKLVGISEDLSVYEESSSSRPGSSASAS